MGQVTLADLISQETKRDPVAFSTSLREKGSLIYLTSILDLGEGWIVTGYDDAAAILKDFRFIKDPLKTSLLGSPKETSFVIKMLSMRRDLLVIDPPDHTRLRHLVSKAFTSRVVEQLRPRIQQIADELLDKVEQQGQMDVITDFAFPLPISVISELLGIPLQDRLQFRIWSQVLISTPQNEMEQHIYTLAEFFQYIKRLLIEKRKHPNLDLISGLVQAEENGDVLSETELVSTIFLLIFAGHETTVNLIGNGMLALLQHPEQMHQLQNDPILLPSAVEELLRYTTPLSFSTVRWASEDVPLGDKVIRKGEPVFISFSAVNTDAQQFHHPEVLDITRQENRHLTFGKGIHSCLGAPLARLEGQIAFGTLLRRLPDLRLACLPEQLAWTPSFLFRELTSLPVTFKMSHI